MDDDEIIQYYQDQYEASGKILDEGEKQSRIAFASYICDFFDAPEDTRNEIINSIERFLYVFFGMWRAKLREALRHFFGV